MKMLQLTLVAVAVVFPCISFAQQAFQDYAYCAPQGSTDLKVSRFEETFVCITFNGQQRSMFNPTADDFSLLNIQDCEFDTRLLFPQPPLNCSLQLPHRFPKALASLLKVAASLQMQLVVRIAPSQTSSSLLKCLRLEQLKLCRTFIRSGAVTVAQSSSHI
jgi:hypothetical protein